VYNIQTYVSLTGNGILLWRSNERVNLQSYVSISLYIFAIINFINRRALQRHWHTHGIMLQGSDVAWAFLMFRTVQDSVDGRSGGPPPANFECVSQICAILGNVSVHLKNKSDTKPYSLWPSSFKEFEEWK